MRVGVLALQGAFAEHINSLRKLGIDAIEVRTKEDLQQVDALILPGGESTAQIIISGNDGLLEELRDFVAKKPTMGTCAGLILLANKLTSSSQKQGGQAVLGGLEVLVDRNHFGRQQQSFEADLEIEDPKLSGEKPFKGIFIRAPAVLSVEGDKCSVLARVRPPQGQEPVIVAVRQGHLLATAFHPELTDDLRWHQYFLEMAGASK